MTRWHEVASLDDIGPEGLEVFVGDDPVLLVRDGEAIRALSAICSHQDKSLQGGCAENGAWLCPHHGARFSLTTGAPLSMPAVEPVALYEVKVEGGKVFVKEQA